MESFDSLLTCCICLDRFRNPKLLPCQHTFCMEPCMEGLIDYVKRQVKCPECRAEHRIPYKGIQEFPSNVTMQRFLDMYSAISGELPDPTQGQVMERCQVCNEKEYLQPCAHCDKKVCPDCKSAHVDVLKRELSRINAQVRRGLHRLTDIHDSVEKNAATLQQNCSAVRQEVDNIGQRLIKAIQDRTEYLKSEVDAHMNTEVRNLSTLKDNLEVEIANIESNSDLAERHMNDNTEWDDAELMDAKDIFLKTVEFIRNFEHDLPGGGDFRRPIRFSAATDPQTLSKTLECFGELNINKPAITDGSQQLGGGAAVVGGYPALMPPAAAGPGLMRSKSDHRLVSALRQQEAGYSAYGDESGRSSPISRRRFGERPPRKESDAGMYGGDDSAYDSPCERRHKYRSRFTRRNLDLDDDLESYRPELHAQPEAPKKKERERVLDTDDATKGPLSGIARISDVPRVIQKLVEGERPVKKKKEEPKKEPVVVQAPAPTAPAPWRRQKSEDDEISKIKKMNKEADARCSQGGAAAAAAAPAEPPTFAPAAPRPPSQPPTSESRKSSTTTAPASPAAPPPAAARRKPSRDEAADDRRPARPVDSVSAWLSEPFETPSSRRVPAAPPAAERAPRPQLRTAPASAQSRSDSTSSESSEASPRTDQTSASTSARPQPAAPPTPPAGSTPASPAIAGPPGIPPTPGTPTSANSRAPFKSRFLHRAPTPKQDSVQDDESSSSEESTSESESETSSEESSDEEDPAPVTRPRVVPNSPAANAVKTGIGSLLARSAHARSGSDDATNTPASGVRQARPTGGYSSRRDSEDVPTAPVTSTSSPYGGRYGASDSTTADTKPYESRYGSRYGDYGNGLTRSRTSSALESRPAAPPEDSYAAYAAKFTRPRTAYNDEYTSPASTTTTAPRYSTTTPSYSSRFLNRSKSSAALDASEEAAESATSSGPAPAVAGGGRTDGTSRYAPPPASAAGERRPWLARSGSSEQADERGASGAAAGGAVSPSRGSPLRASVQRQASGDSAASGSEPAESPSSAAAGSRSEALSSWAQYLKNKYGYRNSKDGGPSSNVGKTLTRSKSSHLMRLPGELLTDEEAPPSLHQAALAAPSAASAASAAHLLLGPRTMYLQKGRLKFKLGCRGGGPGCFTWPRGIAVGPDNSIVVADSSNHRVQVFDQSGTFVKEFGQYGNGEAEFDCLAGVSVNRIGQFIISDRYNHRIQIFDPSGRFLRAFGANGTMEGRFNYPWGVTTDALGFIYVCDKENHRVQVFQSDGTFVGKIGSEGRSSGQLAHPHYIAVSATNRVVVTDSNNHRVQVFDVNGRCLNTFGGEGGEDGKFKFPRGVAVDDEGYIIVGDSGNNRIQVFEPDGTFLTAFGGWGSQDGEFKGLEGVAVMSNGNILVCDRENHRVQVF